MDFRRRQSRKPITAMARTAPTTMPAIAPTGKLVESESGDAADVDEAVDDGVDEEPLEVGDDAEPVKNGAASVWLLDSFAAVSLSDGQPWGEQGFTWQQPMKGGMVSRQVYHFEFWLSTQASGRVSLYLSLEKVALNRLLSGQIPLWSSSHGSILQQPMNCVGLSWQILKSPPEEHESPYFATGLTSRASMADW